MKGIAALRGLSPWSPVESLRVLAVGLVGAALVGAAWWSTSREETWGDQTPWVALGIVGFIVGAYGLVSWLLRARISLLQRRAELLPDVTVAVVPRPSSSVRVVAHPDRGRYHRPSCALAQGRDWPTIDVAELTTADRAPCGVCRP